MIRAQLVLSLVALLVSFSSLSALALDGVGLLDDSSWQKQQNWQGYHMLAQFEGDSSYDPFVDYSEFDATPEEEADINFFLNGRLFTLGFLIGHCRFTKTLGDIYKSALCFGGNLTYFINLRFAMEFNFTTSNHAIDFTSPTKTTVRGNASLTSMGFRFKFYVNTSNVTRGLAQWHPHLLGGFSQFYRTATLSGQTAFSKEGAMGFDLGGGFELPLMREKISLGAQFIFNLIYFRDENSEINLAGGEKTGLYPTGDLLQFLMTLGVNF